LECAGKAQRRRRFGFVETVFRLCSVGEAGSKAPSPLRFAGALQIAVLLSKQLCCYYFSFQNLRPYVH